MMKEQFIGYVNISVHQICTLKVCSKARQRDGKITSLFLGLMDAVSFPLVRGEIQ